MYTYFHLPNGIFCLIISISGLDYYFGSQVKNPKLPQFQIRYLIPNDMTLYLT